MEVPSDILNRYMERRRRDLEACLAHLESKKFCELEKIGHQLKGNGETFGYSELTAIGKKMESAAAKENIPQVEDALEDFSSWVHQHFN